jgi:hypothetical protein
MQSSHWEGAQPVSAGWFNGEGHSFSQAPNYINYLVIAACIIAFAPNQLCQLVERLFLYISGHKKEIRNVIY